MLFLILSVLLTFYIGISFEGMISSHELYPKVLLLLYVIVIILSFIRGVTILQG